MGEMFGRIRGVVLHSGQQVLIGLDRVGDVGVSESFADDLDVLARSDEQRGVGVAQVVEPHSR